MNFMAYLSYGLTTSLHWIQSFTAINRPRPNIMTELTLFLTFSEGETSPACLTKQLEPAPSQQTSFKANEFQDSPSPLLSLFLCHCHAQCCPLAFPCFSHREESYYIFHHSLSRFKTLSKR